MKNTFIHHFQFYHKMNNLNNSYKKITLNYKIKNIQKIMLIIYVNIN